MTCVHCKIPLGRSAVPLCAVCAFCVDVPPEYQDHAADATPSPAAKAVIRERAHRNRKAIAEYREPTP